MALKQRSANDVVDNCALDDFIVGPENSLISVAVESCHPLNWVTSSVIDDGESICPLIFCGPAGRGKSHLALVVARNWQAVCDEKILTLPAVEFARSHVNAIELNDLKPFRLQFQRPCLLVLEDIEQIASKPAAQNELSQLLDERGKYNRLTILTSDRWPGQISGLSARLTSRLGAGLTISIQSPSAATRRQILRSLTAKRNLPVTKGALELLVEKLPPEIPAMQRAVIELLANVRGTSRPIDEPIDRPFLEEFLSEKQLFNSPSLKNVARVTAKRLGVKMSDLSSNSRRKAIVHARSVAMYLARQNTPYSLQQVGKHFGNRDHTTVLHAFRKIERLVESDNELRETVEGLARELSLLADP